MQSNFLKLFSVKKPIIGVIHLKGTAIDNVMIRAKKEIQIYLDHDIDGILIKNYYGNYHQLEIVLEYIKSLGIRQPIGVNVLQVDALGFHLANKFKLEFLQLDSVVGHVKPRDELSLSAFFDLYREHCEAQIIGGVRFKNQPVLSAKTIPEDLQLARRRCDAVAISENGTDKKSGREKLMLFRQALGSFPLVIASGVNEANLSEKLSVGDAAIVGSCFKDTRKITGNISAAHVASFMQHVRTYRQEHEF